MIEDVASQNCRMLETFVWRVGGGGGQVCAPTLQTSVKFRDFEDISLLVFNKSFSNLVRFLILKALFPAESTDFS